MLRKLFLVSVITAGIVTAGCAARVTYDPYYHDYHRWGAAEVPYYNQWIIETHHPHVDYVHLGKHDREGYWRWRHDHP